jgi:hypothetical protein
MFLSGGTRFQQLVSRYRRKDIQGGNTAFPLSDQAALDAAIEQYGRLVDHDLVDPDDEEALEQADFELQHNLSRIYRLVNTWGDLLYTGVAYISNRMYGQLNGRMAKFSAEDPSHAEHSGANLIRINQLGIFTIDGQDPSCTECGDQRGYVTGYVPVSMAPALADALDRDERIYYRMAGPGPGFEFTRDNTPAGLCLSVPRPCEANGYMTDTCLMKVHPFDKWLEKRMKIAEFESPNQRIEDLLFGSVFLDVVARDFCVVSADAVLLEHLEAMQ